MGGTLRQLEWLSPLNNESHLSTGSGFLPTVPQMVAFFGTNVDPDELVRLIGVSSPKVVNPHRKGAPVSTFQECVNSVVPLSSP